MKIIVEVPDDSEIKKICTFCGIEFDQEKMDEYSREDRPRTSGKCSRITVNKRCSLACSWLSDPDMYSILSEPHCDGRNLEYWKSVIAKRVKKEIQRARREEKIKTMQGTIAYQVLEKLGEI